MRCEECQAELAVALLTRAEPDEEVAAHVRHCFECSRVRQELAPLPLLLAAAPAPAEIGADAALLALLQRAAAARRGRRHQLLAAAAAVILLMVSGFVAALPRSNGPALAGATVVGQVSAAVAVAPDSHGTRFSLTVAGMPPGIDCQVSAVTKDGHRVDVVRWTVGYRGTGHVAGTTNDSTADLSRVDLVSVATGQLIASIALQRT